jgi:hypothetical protein
MFTALMRTLYVEPFVTPSVMVTGEVGIVGALGLASFRNDSQLSASSQSFRQYW